MNFLNQFSENINVTVTKKDLMELVNICLIKQNEQKKIFPEHLNIKQLSEYINYSEPAIYKMVAQAVIPSYKIAGKLLFRKSEIDDWIFEFRQPTIKERIAVLKCKEK